MPGFFEKRIMKDVDGRLRTIWPQIPAMIRPSDYNGDGLVIRARPHELGFFDLTMVRGRWTSFLGFGIDGDEIAPGARRYADLGLSVGAPPEQVAPRWYQMIYEDWGSVRQTCEALAAGEIR